MVSLSPMLIADQCRALACQQFAASLNPWTPPEHRAHLATAADWNERMAEALDACALSSASGTDLFALGAAVGVAL